MRAVLVATGDEITNGEVLNSNIPWLAEQLVGLGVVPYAHEAIPDDPDQLELCIRRLGDGADVAVFCGGLGPTSDDYTVDVVARVLGVEAEVEPRALEKAKTFFAQLGRPFVPNSLRQCRVPHGTRVLSNPVGMAPAFSTVVGRCEFYFLPGPPSEFRGCCEACVLPEVAEKVRSLGLPFVARQRYRLVELGESLLAQRVAGLMERHTEARFGFRACYPELWFKVQVEGATRSAADGRLAQIDEEVRAELGELVFGTGETTLEEVVGSQLQQRGLTLVTAESCTGGKLGEALTRVPGSSAWYLGGVVTYSNQLKMSLLGVPPEVFDRFGAVSPECARAMAEGARQRLGADVALSITGIAGPGGGSEYKPVGTVYVALAGPDATICEQRLLRPPRERVRAGAAVAALNMLRLWARG